MLAALLALVDWADPGPPSRADGPSVLLVAEAFELDPARARELAPDPDTRVILVCDDARGTDPLRALPGAPLALDVRASDGDARDRELAAGIGAARTIELLGGTWLAWHRAAQDARHERRWVRALRAAHAGGAAVVATGAAAAWVARWSLQPRDSVGRPAQDPHDSAPDAVVEGLGLYDGPLVGILAPDQPTPDRVVERLVADGWRDALVIGGPAGWLVRADARAAEVLGPGTVAWVALRGAAHSRESLRGARLALLAAGDRWDLARRDLRDALPAQVARLELGPTALDPRDVRRALAGGQPAGADAAASARRVRRACVGSDGATRRSAAGGWADLLLDLELAR